MSEFKRGWSDFLSAIGALLGKWAEPANIVTFALIAMFAYAYFREATPDEQMKGAIIAAFAGAWGYHLGSSRGSAKANELLRQLLAIKAGLSDEKDGEG